MTTEILTPSQIEYNAARAACADRWVPAHGGTETPFVARNGRRYLYCHNFRLARHAYLDLGRDIILTDDEAAEALNW
jgi:hypothetical protein